MKITLIGTGCGTPATLTEEGKRAFERADVIFGAARVLESLPAACTQRDDSSEKKVVEAKPKKICELLAGCIDSDVIENAAVALSGDSGFYSGARLLKETISERFGSITEIEILPGISSVSMFASRLGIPWQNWNLVSAHGADCDPVHEIMKGRETFFLTGGKYTADVICRELTAAGLGSLRVTVGENLSYGKADAETERSAGCTASESGTWTERIVSCTAAECAEMSFSDLSVLLVCTESSDGKQLILQRRPPGIPDDAFIRGNVPMTKMEVRSIVTGKMSVKDSDVVWDIGAGTGSVSVELAMQAGQVWALERKGEAVELICRNRETFGRWNLHVVQGEAPKDLEKLPVPDAVFIGGSGGNVKTIMQETWKRNRAARICVSAVLLETLNECLEAFSENGKEPDIIQIAVTRAEKVGDRHMMKAGNPVYIVTG